MNLVKAELFKVRTTSLWWILAIVLVPLYAASVLLNWAGAATQTGSDAAGGLATWERAEEVRDRATIVVVERPGAPPVPPLAGWRWERVEVPRLEVSSTELRARVEQGRPLDYLVTHEVVACIEERGLYRLASPITPPEDES